MMSVSIYATLCQPQQVGVELSCGCRQCPYTRCLEAEEMYSDLKRANRWDEPQGIRIQLAKNYARHLSGLAFHRSQNRDNQ